MLTEAEAKTRWCPFAVAAHWNAPTGGNRLMRNDVPSSESPVAAVCRCIASACMAWRWSIGNDGVTAYKVTKDPASPGHFDNAPMGFCGLAGRPA